VKSSRDPLSRVASEPAAQAETDDQESPLRFSNLGPIPPVMAERDTHSRSASERAYEDVQTPMTSGGQIMAREMDEDRAAIVAASRRYGIPEVDILAVITQESRGSATANAGAHQHDHGAHAASGLMQVTEATWRQTQRQHDELAGYSFAACRYDRRINILFGTAALADKRAALERLGVPANGANATALTTMAFNAGEGIVSDAYHRAVQAGAPNPAVDCLQAEYLRPAIAKYPSVYSYYLTGGGKSRNPGRSISRAVDLKFQEISKYPVGVEMLISEAQSHQLADDQPAAEDQILLAEADRPHDRSA
jgi:hypothetical protein